jgi:hypothetical protein
LFLKHVLLVHGVNHAGRRLIPLAVPPQVELEATLEPSSSQFNFERQNEAASTRGSTGLNVKTYNQFIHNCDSSAHHWRLQHGVKEV